MKVALDTNVLVYAERVNGADKGEQVLDVLRRLPPDAVMLPVQVLGELFNVLVRKAGRPREQARAAILSWRDSFDLIETSAEVMFAAADLASDHQLPIWDAVILCAASQAGCRLLLSEDFQDGFTWGGLTVVDPFAPIRHPLLEGLIDPAPDRPATGEPPPG